MIISFLMIFILFYKYRILTKGVLYENLTDATQNQEEVKLPEKIPSPVKMRNNSNRDVRMANNKMDINKRLSLPLDLNIPDEFVIKHLSSLTLNEPLTKTARRQSLTEIGFGCSETYTKLSKLGQGTYANVYKGKSKLTDSFVALKEIKLERLEGAPCTALREASLLKSLKHANIVTLHDIVYTDSQLMLVFEYLDKDLKQYMDDCGTLLNLYNVKLYLFQLLRGLAYCHSKKVLHRDLKPQNLLVNSKGELKLGDFGLARAKSVPTKTFSHEVVTLWYRPPDVLLGNTEYSTQIDIWGVGCIFFEMVMNKPLFPGANIDDQLDFIFQAMGTPPYSFWDSLKIDKPNYPIYEKVHLRYLKTTENRRLPDDAILLLYKFLVYEAKERISANDAMKDAYFEELGEEIHKLPRDLSIFTISTIRLREEGTSYDAGKKKGKKERQN